MLNALSSLKGFKLQAKDGSLGTVSDFLFDDSSWKVRWMVVDTGSWMTERMVLVHPSSVISAEFGARDLNVDLTKDQVEGSPDILHDRPVSRQMQNDLYTYYGLDPLWIGGISGGGMYGGMAGIASPVLKPTFFGAAAERNSRGHHESPSETSHDEADPHLRSIAEVSGYHVHATDGDLGHIQDFLVDNVSWEVRYLIVDTSNWWFGQHVLVSPSAVTSVDWADRHVRLDIDRDMVKSSPAWDSAKTVSDEYEQRLQNHYDWPSEPSSQASTSPANT